MQNDTFEQLLLGLHAEFEKILRQEPVPRHPDTGTIDFEQYQTNVLGKGLNVLREATAMNYVDVVIYEIGEAQKQQEPNGTLVVPKFQLFTLSRWQRVRNAGRTNGNDKTIHQVPSLRYTQICSDHFYGDGSIEHYAQVMDPAQFTGISPRTLESGKAIFVRDNEEDLHRLLEPDIRKGCYKDVDEFVRERMHLISASGKYQREVTYKDFLREHYGPLLPLGVLRNVIGVISMRRMGKEDFKKLPDKRYMEGLTLIGEELSRFVERYYLLSRVMRRAETEEEVRRYGLDPLRILKGPDRTLA